jgi:hypothetical protein
MQTYINLEDNDQRFGFNDSLCIDLLTFCKPKCPTECCGYLDYGKLLLTTSSTISAVDYRRFALALEACPSGVYRTLQRSRVFL